MWTAIRAMFAPKPPSLETVHQPPAEFGLAMAPVWVLEWAGWVRPHGGGYRGRLSLWDGSAPVLATVESPMSRSRPVCSRLVQLSEPAVGRLRTVLRDAFPEQLLSVPERCRDGFPFEVIVHRREPYQGVRARCNVGDGLDGIQPWTGNRSWSELAEVAAEMGRPLAPVFRLGFVLLELSLTSMQGETSTEAALP